MSARLCSSCPPPFSPFQGAQIKSRSGDWIARAHETVQGGQIRLDGNLILEEGAVLEFEDGTLEIVGRYSQEILVNWREE